MLLHTAVECQMVPPDDGGEGGAGGGGGDVEQVLQAPLQVNG